MKKPLSPEYYTPSEAAAILKVDRRTVYEWLRSKKLKGVRFGDSWRIQKSSLFPAS